MTIKKLEGTTELNKVKEAEKAVLKMIDGLPLTEYPAGQKKQFSQEELSKIRERATLLAHKFGLLNEALRIASDVVVGPDYQGEVYHRILEMEPVLCSGAPGKAYDERAFLDSLKMVEFFAKSFLAAQEDRLDSHVQSHLAASVAIAEIESASKVILAPLTMDEKIALLAQARRYPELLKTLGETSSLAEIEEMAKILDPKAVMAILNARIALDFIFELSEKDKKQIQERYGLRF